MGSLCGGGGVEESLLGELVGDFFGESMGESMGESLVELNGKFEGPI